MSRVIGIDYGKKRVGVAVSDPLGIIAQPLSCVSAEQVIAYLLEYAKKENVVKFVVGYPKNLDNTPAECAAYVEQFLKRLKKSFPTIPVELEDERFTTVLAQRAMIDGGMKKSERRQKGAADKISAVLILQSWLDRQSRV
ncbi:MAG: Holliday junction resolvase RuvX [Bacteroidales bacterium]|nr:Holliday junction resolvase RuvX [Bacteroidales bacterium]